MVPDRSLRLGPGRRAPRARRGRGRGRRRAGADRVGRRRRRARLRAPLRACPRPGADAPGPRAPARRRPGGLRRGGRGRGPRARARPGRLRRRPRPGGRLPVRGRGQGPVRHQHHLAPGGHLDQPHRRARCHRRIPRSGRPAAGRRGRLPRPRPRRIPGAGAGDGRARGHRRPPGRDRGRLGRRRRGARLRRPDRPRGIGPGDGRLHRPADGPLRPSLGRLGHHPHRRRRVVRRPQAHPRQVRRRIAPAGDFQGLVLAWATLRSWQRATGLVSPG